MQNIQEKELWKDRKRTTFLGLPWSFTKYRLTSSRFFMTTGILNTKEDEVRLYRITDISLTKSFIQRLFGLGTITCVSSDKTIGTFVIKNIKNPSEVKELISAWVEHERQEHRVITRENMVDFSDDIDDYDI